MKMLDIITQPATLIAFGAVVLLFVLFALWRIRRRHIAAVAETAKREEAATQAEMAAAREQAAFSEEIRENLRGMNESITRAMSEMERTHKTQLDAIGGQLRDMSDAGSALPAEDALQEYGDRLDHIEQLLTSRGNEGDAQLERVAQTLSDKIDRVLGETQRRMELMQTQVDQRLHASLEHTLGESFQLVSDRLEQVYKGLGEMQSLASGVGDLKKVLSGVNAKGAVGEIQLSALLMQVLSADQYEKSKPLSDDGEMVDYVVKLPGRSPGEPQCVLPIDARFPQAAYAAFVDAVESGDTQEMERAAADMQDQLIETAQFLSRNFVNPPFTTDFVVLFLPSEGLYAEMLRRPGLSETLQREHHVMLTGPSTLAALLNSLQMGFKTLAIERRSEEVWALLGAVRGEFVNFADALVRTQKRIRQASESIEDAARKSKTIQKKLKTVESLDSIRRKELFGDAAGDDQYGDEMDEWD